MFETEDLAKLVYHEISTPYWIVRKVRKYLNTFNLLVQINIFVKIMQTITKFIITGYSSDGLFWWTSTYRADESEGGRTRFQTRMCLCPSL